MIAAELLETEVRYVSGDDVAGATTVGALDADRGGSGAAGPSCAVTGRSAALLRVVLVGDHGRARGHESRLELDRLWLADFDVQVERIAAEPVWLVGRDAPATPTSRRRCTPGVGEVRRCGGRAGPATA